MSSNRSKAAIAATLIAVGVLAGTGFARYWTPAQNTQAIEWLDSPRALNDFQLQTAQGRFERSDLLGAWHLVLFGYTHCPDICPTSLAELGRLADLLPDTSPEVIFISIDPRRDTPQALANYVTYFNASFTGVTGDQATLEAIADSLGIRFKVSGPPEKPQIAHSLTISLLGPDGKLRGRIRPGFDIDAAAADIAHHLSPG